MKIITLNTWGGRAGREGLLAFIEKHKADTDIFCFQEIWSAPHDYLNGVAVGGVVLDSSKIMTHGLQDISASLDNFEPYFNPHYTDHYGLLMMINKGLRVKNQGEVYVYKDKGYSSQKDVGNHARNIQYAEVEKNGRDFMVVNFHGLWNGKGKDDCDERLLQSDNIISFLKKAKTPIIFCGDFNLNPETESLKKFEAFGLRNLIREYKVTSTRTSLYTKPAKFADYIFVSKDLKVQDFEVLTDEVSDHSPLSINLLTKG